MRDRYEAQLGTLNRYIEEMGEEIEKAISQAIDALLEKNPESARETIRQDLAVNHKEREIENLCLKLLLSQQPVATDLRMVSAALKMVTDMERIGDHAADISEITLLLVETGYPNDLLGIRKMAEETIYMVKESIAAYMERNGRRALEVIRHDDVVDACFVEIKRSLITQINESVKNGEQAADILLIAKYLERIGDHATNIAEWVLFYITGEHPAKPV